jgi:hypothetical protein
MGSSRYMVQQQVCGLQLGAVAGEGRFVRVLTGLPLAVGWTRDC